MPPSLGIEENKFRYCSSLLFSITETAKKYEKGRPCSYFSLMTSEMLELANCNLDLCRF